jgi:hypothetical protein
MQGFRILSVEMSDNSLERASASLKAYTYMGQDKDRTEKADTY